MSTKSKLKEDY